MYSVLWRKLLLNGCGHLSVQTPHGFLSHCPRGFRDTHQSPLKQEKIRADMLLSFVWYSLIYSLASANQNSFSKDAIWGRIGGTSYFKCKIIHAATISIYNFRWHVFAIQAGTYTTHWYSNYAYLNVGISHKGVAYIYFMRFMEASSSNLFPRWKNWNKEFPCYTIPDGNPWSHLQVTNLNFGMFLKSFLGWSFEEHHLCTCAFVVLNRLFPI